MFGEKKLQYWLQAPGSQRFRARRLPCRVPSMGVVIEEPRRLLPRFNFITLSGLSGRWLGRALFALEVDDLLAEGRREDVAGLEGGRTARKTA